MKGDVARFCDCGGCLQPAAFIGSYTTILGEAKTLAACTPDHLGRISAQQQTEGYLLKWSDFPNHLLKAKP